MGSWKVTKDPPQDSFLYPWGLERKPAVAAGRRVRLQTSLAAAGFESGPAAIGYTAECATGTALELLRACSLPE